MNNQEKKNEVVTKQKVGVGTQIGIGIAVLAIVAAGGGLAAFFAVQGGTSSGSPTPSAGLPGAFKLLSPADNAVDQDDAVTLQWSASSRATSYDVYLGIGSVGAAPVANVTVTSYGATQLTVGSLYYWKIVAKNAKGSTPSSIWSFATADDDWLRGQGYTPVDESVSSACGANQQCDDDNVLSCAEFNSVWLACNGINNRCPDNLAEQCLQMTVCQCSGVSPGSPDCTTFVESFADPCI